MSIGIKAQYNPLVKRGVGLFVSRFAQETEDAFTDVYPPIRAEMLNDLRRVPTRRFWTQDDWTSEKQRRAFFATNGFGGGIPHHRTNKIPGGWQVNEHVSGVTINVEVKNPVEGSTYVYGSLSAANAGKYQQKGHVRTGWPNGYQVITFWLSALRDDLIDALHQRLGDVVAGVGERRRAYTRIRPRARRK